mmetsp:Transcript_3705/g.2761  ORF Transcript_3705/g.2761 Transcript_3705/m.2761 type:complete len:139 (-) Transcript_3705:50-466(-)
MELINVMLGYPPKEMIARAKKRKQFFDKDGNVIVSKKSRINGIISDSFPLKENMNYYGDGELFDLVRRCLETDPHQRITPEEALKHPWIVRGYGLNDFSEHNFLAPPGMQSAPASFRDEDVRPSEGNMRNIPKKGVKM